MKLKKIIIVMLLVGFVCAMPDYHQVVQTAARLSGSGQPKMTLVIDPGHGGMDGGAAGADGTTEQKINLDIAKALQAEAERYGVKAVLTRETEDGLQAPDESSGKWTKLGDMKARKAVIDKEQPDLTVSIHLNSFLSDSSVHGAQVFYPKAVKEEQKEDNKQLAEEIQAALETQLPGSDDRIVLPKEGMYLFRDPEHPMILIECGFLSNPGDLQSLKSTEYQQKIASAAMGAIAKYYRLSPLQKELKDVVDSRTSSRK